MGAQRVGRAGVLAAALLVLPVACGEDGEPAGDASGAVTTSSTSAEMPDPCAFNGESSAEATTPAVEVTLSEWAMSSTPAQVPAGPTEIVAVNDGLALHEVAIVRFDGDAAALPLNEVGGADLTQLPEGALVGRIRPFPSGLSCRATFDLEPGSYALICNVVDDGSNPHYSNGMYATFTVT